MIRKVHNSKLAILAKIARVDRRIRTIGSEIRADVALSADTGQTLSRMAARDMLARKRIKLVNILREVTGSGPDCGKAFNPDCNCPDCAGALSPFPS